jgi:polar amino acid transport system permease protein
MTTDAPEIIPSRPNPHKRNFLIQRLSRGPWWLLILITGIFVFAVVVSEMTFYQRAWDEIKGGIRTTIEVTLIAYSAALLLGLIIALLRRPSKSVIYTMLVYQPVTTLMELIRGIPTVVLILYIALGLTPELVRQGNALGEKLLDTNVSVLVDLGEWLEELSIRDIGLRERAISALALSYGAFLSEVFRAGIESVPEGQREAARSLGMSTRQVNRLVVLPQAIRNVLPPLGNDFIAMLKESSLVSFVGVRDITLETKEFNSATLTVLPAYNILALTYLSLTLSLSIIVKALETYLNRFRRTGQ